MTMHLLHSPPPLPLLSCICLLRAERHKAWSVQFERLKLEQRMKIKPFHDRLGNYGYSLLGPSNGAIKGGLEKYRLLEEAG